MTRGFFRGALRVSALALFCPAAALAHITLEKAETTPLSTYKAVLRVSHGCGGTPTTAISVKIPEGIIAAKPMPKPGWTLDIVKGPYARDYTLYHATVSSGTTQITWKAGSLPDDQYDEFVFSAYVSDALPAGGTVYFPVVQTCATGDHHWVETPTAGQDAHALKEPAPGLKIVAAQAETPKAVKVGALDIVSPWLRATPGGATVAAGYLTIVNTGKNEDRLIGASISGAGKGEVHETSMTDGVMRMRRLADGVAIGPGQTVELKPSGLHIMFLDLTRALKDGDHVGGSLTFAKAGTVPIEFAVRGVGGMRMPEDHNH